MEETIVKSATMEGAVPLPEVHERTENAEIYITFSENNMEAWGAFFPCSGNGIPLTQDYVKSVLNKNEIIFGIQNQTIKDAIRECNSAKKILRSVLLAQGSYPVNGIPEYMQINPALGRNLEIPVKIIEPLSADPNKVPDKNDRVDYRAMRHFIIVKKGQALAKLKTQKPGVNGRNVNGTLIPCIDICPQSVSGGDNTIMEGKILVAAIDGQLVETAGVLHVRETLNIEGPVDYHTGHIEFPGDVVIEGPVSDGFKLYSGGSIRIKQTLDVTDAVSKGDLNVSGGIIGRGHALVKVGGNLRTRFIDNCHIACRKTVSVTSEIINSRIYAMEKLEMGGRGIIIGGEIFAINGIHTGGIGKESSRISKIHCGIDFTMMEEKEKYNHKLRIIAAKLERIRQLLEDPCYSAKEKARLEVMRTRLKGEQKLAMEKTRELLGRLHINENACIEVSGEIAAGTMIEICQARSYLAEPLTRVRIRLDKANNRLIAANL